MAQEARVLLSSHPITHSMSDPSSDNDEQTIPATVAINILNNLVQSQSVIIKSLEKLLLKTQKKEASSAVSGELSSPDTTPPAAASTSVPPKAETSSVTGASSSAEVSKVIIPPISTAVSTSPSDLTTLPVPTPQIRRSTLATFCPVTGKNAKGLELNTTDAEVNGSISATPAEISSLDNKPIP